MTRQNVTEGVREIMTRPCPTCDGDGVVLSEETIAIEFERRLRELAARAPRTVEAFLVQMNPQVSSQFTGQGARVLHALEEETGKHFHFTGSEGLPLDHFDVVREGPLDEIREEAVPFREGDEVLVDDRRAAHVRGRRRRGQDRRLHRLGARRRARTWARSASCASRRPGAPRRPPSSWPTAPARRRRAAPPGTGTRMS